MEDSPVPPVGAQGTSMSPPYGAGFLGLIKYYYETISKPSKPTQIFLRSLNITTEQMSKQIY